VSRKYSQTTVQSFKNTMHANLKLYSRESFSFDIMQLNSERLGYTLDKGSGIEVFWCPAQVIIMDTFNRKDIFKKKSQLVTDLPFIWLNNLKCSEHRTSILFHLKYSFCHPLESTLNSSHTTSLHTPLPLEGNYESQRA
jgi:hypothetical protein